MAFQAAAATPVVSTAMVTTGTGGLLQSLVPTHGTCTGLQPTTLSSEATTIKATAFLARCVRD